MSNKHYYWTTLTAFCFERKFKCKHCSEFSFCDKRACNNDYGIKKLKFDALQTYANIGLEGFEEALNSIGEPRNRMKDVEI